MIFSSKYVQRPLYKGKLLPVLSLIFFFFCCSVQSYSQGKIEKSKQEIKEGRKKDPAKEPAKQTPAVSSPACDNEKTIGELFKEIVSTAFLYTTFYSTIGNYHTEDHLKNKPTPYPYYNNHSGNYESSDSGSHTKNHLRFYLDYQFLYSNKNLTGHHATFNFRPLSYFYLQAQYHLLKEFATNNRFADLSLFHLYFCYDRLKFERFNFGWKLGVSYIAGNVNRAGFSGALDAEAFIVKPFSLYISKQWGSIHNVPVNTFEISGKFYKKRYNIHLGYERLKIGSPVYSYFLLGAGVHL